MKHRLINSSKWLVSIMVTISFSIIFIISACFGSSTDKHFQTKNIDLTQKQNVKIQEPIKVLSYEDFAINTYWLGTPLWMIQHGHPTPKRQVQSQRNIIYEYDDVEVTVSAENRVVGINTDNTKISTARGIHPGSLLQEVLDAYGENPKVTSFGEYKLYEYAFEPSCHKLVLRFAVKNGTGTVNYLGSRLEGEDQITRSISEDIKPTDVVGSWWTDFGFWTFNLKLQVVNGEILGSHSAMALNGRKMDIARNNISIRGVFNNKSPIAVRFKSYSSGVEGDALIVPLNEDCIWWHIIATDRVDEYYLPRDAVLYKDKE